MTKRGLDDLVAAQQRQIEAQQRQIGALSDLVEKQTNLIATALGVPRPAAPPPSPVEDSPTFGALWERYLKTLPSVPWLKSVISNMGDVLARFGARKVADLKPSDWSDFRDEELKPRLSVMTRNLKLRRARAVLNWAEREGRIERNPFTRVKPERNRPPRETEVSLEGLHLIMRHCPEWLQDFIILAFETGMRHTEVRTLTRDQVDLERRVLVLSWVGTKTKRTRLAPLSDWAVEVLRRRLGIIRGANIFEVAGTSRAYSKTTVLARFRKAVDAAGVKAAPGDGEVRVHDLRGSFATRMDRAGVSIKTIQILLGHTTIRMTEKYMRVVENDLHTAIGVLQASERKPPHRIAAAQTEQTQDVGRASVAQSEHATGVHTAAYVTAKIGDR